MGVISLTQGLTDFEEKILKNLFERGLLNQRGKHWKVWLQEWTVRYLEIVQLHQIPWQAISLAY